MRRLLALLLLPLIALAADNPLLPVTRVNRLQAVPGLSGIVLDSPMTFRDPAARAAFATELGSAQQLLSDLPGQLSLSAMPTGSVDPYSSISEEIDSRIRSRTANDANKLIYSTLTSTTAVRSSTSWAANVDLSGVAFWQSQNGHQIPITAITPVHGVSAWHANGNTGIAVGTVVRWLGRDGIVVERLVAASVRVGVTDINRITFSAALPATVTPVQVLPSSFATTTALTSVAGLPAMHIDQERKALVKQLASTGNYAAMSGQRLAFNETLIDGDSGSPGLLLVNGKPVLVLVASSGGSEGSGAYIDFSVLAPLVAPASLQPASIPSARHIVRTESLNAAVGATAGQIPLVDGTGKLASSIMPVGVIFSGSLGGNGAADSTKAALFGTSGQLRSTGFISLNATFPSVFSATISYDPSLRIINHDDSGYGLEVSAGIPFIGNGRYDLLNLYYVSNVSTLAGQVLRFRVADNGSLAWPDASTNATAKATTRANLEAVRIVTKTTTGDPSATEPTIAINEADNTVRIWAEGAWRTIASW
jgi:hypothetical protein